jgi:hypothetical protein
MEWICFHNVPAIPQGKRELRLMITSASGARRRCPRTAFARNQSPKTVPLTSRRKPSRLHAGLGAHLPIAHY